MAKTEITFDTREFQSAMRQFTALAKKDAETVVRDEMRLLTQRLGELTPPAHGRGSGKAAQRLGEGAVASDIQKVFFPVKGKISLLSAYHQQARNNRGRVRRGTKRVPVNANLLRRYIKLIQTHVGRAKAGWNSAASAFKAPGIPGWVRRHGRADGGYTDALRKGSGYLEASNRNKAIGNLNQEARIVSAAMVGRLRDLKSKIERILNRNAQRISARKAA